MTSYIALKTMMQATANELKDLRQSAVTLQSSIAPQTAANNEAMESLQQLDYLTQSLEALSALWTSLADKAPTDWSLDAAKDVDKVLLRDLAERLQGRDVQSATQGCLEEF